MPSLTLKNIPDKLLKALRKAADGDRRSLNQEILRLLEEALDGRKAGTAPAPRQDAQAQIEAWRKLAGQWQSDLSPEEEGRQLMDARTRGREVDF
jgi:hypothetical protein